ncbi:acetyltransferase [Oceaniferula spumae]|uniref:Acetyltransferase n=1 Tax=Oceaniferula spumae TaxID=2979115 RepID=A0AAT9FNT6_9BACT
MAIFGQHDASHPDALMRPMQSSRSKLRRAIWLFTWAVLCRLTPNPMHRWRCFVLRMFGAKLGQNNFIYPSARIWAPWLLETGNVATIASRVYVYNVGGVTIGHHAIVSEGAFICGATHDYQSADFPLRSYPVEIGAHVWICAQAIVLPGVTCGEGAVLGAGAVCSKDLEPWTVYAGNPAQRRSSRNVIPDLVS